MNVYSITKKFHTQEDCINYLEGLRWAKGKVVCPYCGGTNNVKLKKELRHHCNVNGCKRNFSVMVGTIFEDSRLPLPKFFALISLMLHARGGISAMQLSRNLGISYKASWYGAMRARCAMVETIDNLHGIVETDETYLTPKKKLKRKPAYNKAIYSQVLPEKPKRGHGTNKVLVSGWTERDGRLVMKMLKDFKTESLLTLLRKHVTTKNTTLMTDDLKSYKAFDSIIDRESVKHSKKEYARGNAHVNTLEGIWNVIKSGLRGQYRVLSEKYLPFYLAEFAYKYNRRNYPSLQFEAFMKDATGEHKCMLCYKPEKKVSDIVYPRKDKAPKAFLGKFKKANTTAGKKRSAKADRRRKKRKEYFMEKKKYEKANPQKKSKTTIKKQDTKPKVWRTASPLKNLTQNKTTTKKKGAKK